MTGHDLEKAIRSEFSGDIMDGLIAILQCTTNKAEFFASRLHKSMAGIGTNDQQLIRLVVTRCEIDLNDIKVAFERVYGKSLRSWIKVRDFGESHNLVIGQFSFFLSFTGRHIGSLQTCLIRFDWRTTFIVILQGSNRIDTKHYLPIFIIFYSFFNLKVINI